MAMCWWPLSGQAQTQYVASNVTGQVVLTATVNVSHQSQSLRQLSMKARATPEFLPTIPHTRLRPPVSLRLAATRGTTTALKEAALGVGTGSPAFGFMGITHLQQRLANGGNQFSVEPPNPSIAAGNGYLLEGVNNAIQVFDMSGNPRLPAALSSNQLFALPAAIDRTTGVRGVFPTDMRVFYDNSIRRWFVIQRAQLNDISGAPLPQSKLYIAVSQADDPTGVYNIYVVDTTNPSNFNCPCVADFPQIGADQYGFYISTNEFNWYYPQFVDANIWALSKSSLASGAALPTAVKFTIPYTSGYEFAIQPATTPPGASPFLANGGVEFFVSTQASFASDSQVAVWAMSNTASLQTALPSLVLTTIRVPTMLYSSPNAANQRPGILPYGSSLIPPRGLEYLDGADRRVLSAAYSGGRIYATFGAQVSDDSGRSLSGGAYLIVSPTFRGAVLNATVIRQGTLAVNGNHLLRPAIAVDSRGKGAIAFTLVGPDYYPSAAFVPIDTFSTGTTIQVPGPGAFPEDGFTGYDDGSGLARWGDYATAVADANGAIWMVVEYIPNAPRTEYANWGTYLTRYLP
jgi:hypothetical protein